MREDSTKEAGERTIGIIGGMGPAATVELMSRIIRKTPAEDDRDHVRLLVDSNPKVPSRIAAILEKTGTDPTPTLVAMAKGLEAAGAGLLVMPCNTAHHYHVAIAAAVNIPFISIVDVAVEHLRRNAPHARRIGLLASPAVQQTGVYDAALARAGFTPAYPDERVAARLLTIIKDVKAGDAGTAQAAALEEAALVFADSVDAMLVACTELSILPPPDLGAKPLFDTLDLLAAAAIEAAKSV